MLLESIDTPSDLRRLSYEQLAELAAELRAEIVRAVEANNGHLGSNLGVVELTLAMHRVFDSPRDVLLWDTGHQAYVHKMVTGRRDQFARLRQAGGLSGYPSRAESEHDWIENSHASTILCYAHGLAEAFKLRGDDERRVVAVIGDGSLTGGMAFEGLNNLGHSDSRAVIILNDNGRSYAPTVSKLGESLSRLRLNPFGEVMRVRAAALAGDRVDRFDAVGAHLVQALGGERDDLRFLHARLERLRDVLVDAVDHRRSHVEERELVDVLYLARFEHDLLPVAHLDALFLQREEHRRLDDVDAERHPGNALLFEDPANFLCRLRKEREIRAGRAAHAEHPGAAVVLAQPRRVEFVVARGAAEVPDVGLAVPGEKRIARELVARPLADHRARGVADVVLVEREQRAEARVRQRGAHAREPVTMQPAKVDAFLEIDLRAARRLQRTIPTMLRVDVVRSGLSFRHAASSRVDSSP